VPAAISLLTPEETADIVGVTDAFLDPSRGPKVADYVERFQKRFNLRPDPYGSCFYDGAMILKSAIEVAGTDKAKLRDYLKSVKNHEGVTQVFNTDAHGNMVHSVAVVKFKPGTTELTYVKTITV
jgi:branched-chain amino acid transport system substrate-binding protein